MSQLVLDTAFKILAAPTKSKFGVQTLLIPAVCAVVSVVAFLLHVIFTSGPVKGYVAKLRGREAEEDVDALPAQPIVRQHSGFFPDLRLHIHGHGGAAIFTWKMIRLLACVALTAFTIVAVVLTNEGHKTVGTKDTEDWDADTLSKHWGKKHRKHKKHHKRERWFSTAEWMEISLCMFYVSIFFRLVSFRLSGYRPIQLCSPSLRSHSVLVFVLSQTSTLSYCCSSHLAFTHGAISCPSLPLRSTQPTWPAAGSPGLV
jgi:hypothetical protein